MVDTLVGIHIVPLPTNLFEMGSLPSPFSHHGIIVE